jgi:hypothetical protein
MSQPGHTVRGMAESPKVQLDYPEDPFGEPEGLSAREVETQLGELLGGEWAGYYRGQILPGSALWARFTKSESGRQVLSGLLLLGDAITGEQLRKVPVAVMENSQNLTEAYWKGELREDLAKLPPLQRQSDMSAEDFSRLVAEHYRAWAKAVPSPAAAIAAEWGVKPPTVHSWIREARLRGFLPPARRGKSPI